jgi:hypothetical protein
MLSVSQCTDFVSSDKPAEKEDAADAAEES